MQCPNCKQVEIIPEIPCSNCDFQASAEALQQLDNLTYLLEQIANWHFVPIRYRATLSDQYQAQYQQLEIELGLRIPPPTFAEAEALRAETQQYSTALEALLQWEENGWLTSTQVEELQAKYTQRQQQIRLRLKSAPISPQPSEKEQVEQKIAGKLFLVELLNQLGDAGTITPTAQEAALTQLETEIHHLSPPPPEPQIQPETIDDEQDTTVAETPIAESEILVSAEAIDERRQTTTAEIQTPQPEISAPKPRFTLPSWERVWETILSERTLKAVLFLGVLLVFAGSVLWIARNWNNFSPIAQIGLLGSYTGLFYVTGWYVRKRLQLRESGIALSAVASLLVPLDFLAFYLSGGFPQESWRWVWLGGSLICLAAYLLATYAIQAEFFGYLVAVAIGSTAVAGISLTSLSSDWWQLGVAISALGLISATGLLKHLQKWQIVVQPFWHMGIAGILTAIAFGMGYGFTQGGVSLTFLFVVGINWCIGGVVFLLASKKYQLSGLVLLAAISFPAGIWLIQHTYIIQQEIAGIWVTLGWSLLLPFYLLTIRYLDGKVGENKVNWRGWTNRNFRNAPSTPTFYSSARQNLLVATVLLTTLTAILSLGSLSVTRWVHLILTGSMLLGVWLWRSPSWLPAFSLLLTSSSGAWVANQADTAAELALPWALLAILHIIVAWRLRHRTIRYDTPLFIAGLFITFAALLPPLFVFDKALFTYALGNWIGINGWLAYLSHQKISLGISQIEQKRPLKWLGESGFHWLAGLPALAWLWQFWELNSTLSAWTGVAYALFAWGALWVATRVRRYRWAYHLPWQTTAHFANISALTIGIYKFDQPLFALTLWSVALFYLFATPIFRRNEWAYFGALFVPFAIFFTLDWLDTPPEITLFLISLLVPIYVACKAWLTNKYPAQPDRYEGLEFAGILLFVLLPLISIEAVFTHWDSPNLIWLSFFYLALAVGAGILAWHKNNQNIATISTFTSLVSAGLVLRLLSSGTGRSAIWGALLAFSYILTERALIWAWRHPQRWSQANWMPAFIRKLWWLYRSSLKWTGWFVSGGVIGWALVRNLVWLEPTMLRQSYSIIALWLIVGFYIFCAVSYRQPIFAWLASLTIIAPWSLLQDLGWYISPRLQWNERWHHAPNWIVLGIVLLGASWLLTGKFGRGKWRLPAWTVAQFLVPFALLWSMGDNDVTIITIPFGIFFYFIAVWYDRVHRPESGIAHATFLHPLAWLLPAWALTLGAKFGASTDEGAGLTLLAFGLPALLLGRRLFHWERGYGTPFYLMAYGCTIIGTYLLQVDPVLFGGALLFSAGLAIFSAWLFSEPLWGYPAVFCLPFALFSWQDWLGLSWQQVGWATILIAGSYMLIAHWLRQTDKPLYSTAPIIGGFLLLPVGIFLSSSTPLGIAMGYSLAMLVYAGISFWLKQPFLMFAVTPLFPFAFIATVTELGIRHEMGLALCVAILFTALIGWGLDQWAKQAWREQSWGGRLAKWWGLSWHLLTIFLCLLAPAYALSQPSRLFITMLVGLTCFGWFTTYFRSRWWLFMAGGWGHLTILALYHWAGWLNDGATTAFLFLPVTILTAASGIWVQQRLKETPPFPLTAENRSWSAPLYYLLGLDLFFWQMFSFNLTSASGWITLTNLLILTLLSLLWLSPILANIVIILGGIGLAQWLDWYDVSFTTVPVAYAILATLYGTFGYGIQYLRERIGGLPASDISPQFFTAIVQKSSVAGIWQTPLQIGSWGISFLTIVLALVGAPRFTYFLVRAMVQQPVILPADIPQLLMVVRVLGILGLLYLFAAIVARNRLIAYGALASLLGSWGVWLLLLQGQRELQLYAIPAGIYLLFIGWLEWRYGNRRLSAWVDRVALLLLLGSSFWQSFGENGSLYAGIMLLEGLLLVWWGSFRRLRRLLYAGVMGVILAVTGQLLEPLLALDSWVLLLLGMGLLMLGVALQQRLEVARQLSRDLLHRLEDWA